MQFFIALQLPADGFVPVPGDRVLQITVQTELLQAAQILLLQDAEKAFGHRQVGAYLAIQLIGGVGAGPVTGQADQGGQGQNQRGNTEPQNFQADRRSHQSAALILCKVG